MRIRVSMVGLIGSAVVATMLVMGACSGTKKDPTATGGSSGELGGAGNTEEGGAATDVGGAGNGGATTASGGTDTAAGGADAVGGNTSAAGASAATPFECKKGVPAAAEVAPGTNGIWGTSSAIAGGTFLYQDVDAHKFVVDTATTTGSVNLTSTIVAGGYSGYGIYFKDPEKCWDASAYTGGVSVTIGGDLGGGKILFQVQTNSDYPIDTKNSKGACEGTWSSGCGNNTTAALEIAATPTAIQIPWADINGGSPNAAVDPSEMLGIQFQINCPQDAAADCTPNVTIGAISFY